MEMTLMLHHRALKWAELRNGSHTPADQLVPNGFLYPQDSFKSSALGSLFEVDVLSMSSATPTQGQFNLCRNHSGLKFNMIRFQKSNTNKSLMTLKT